MTLTPYGFFWSFLFSGFSFLGSSPGESMLGSSTSGSGATFADLLIHCRNLSRWSAVAPPISQSRSSRSANSVCSDAKNFYKFWVSKPV
jgi:hypothetical protein